MNGRPVLLASNSQHIIKSGVGNSGESVRVRVSRGVRIIDHN